MQQVPGQDGDKTKRRQARKASETTTHNLGQIQIGVN